MMNYYKIDDLLSDQVVRSGSSIASTLIVMYQNDYQDGSAKLNEILKAIQLNSHTDTKLALVISGDSVNLSQLNVDDSTEKVITFGWPVNQLAPNMEGNYYQLITTERYQWLPAPLLSDVLKNKQQKMALWKTLQQMYLK
jgi:DNA polymerase III psi subunit